MIGTALAAYGGGSVITGVLMLIVKMFDKKAENSERQTLLAAETSKMNSAALDAVAYRTNNTWGNLSRVWMLLVTDLIFIASIIFGALNPDVIIWVGQEQEQNSFSLLGLIEFKWGATVDWRQFNGMVLLPIYFARAGALTAYYLVGGMWSRR